MKIKICTRCKIEKPLSEFPKHKTMKDGYLNQCKECTKQIKKEWDKNNKEYRKLYQNKYYKEHEEEIKIYKKQYNVKWHEDNKEYNQQYYQNNKEIIILNVKEYANEHKEEIRENNRNKYQKNKKVINIKKKDKYKNDMLYRLKHLMGGMLRKTFKKIGTKKEKRTVEELGYFPLKLMQRLEMNFTEDMTWDNYGEWEIDHTIPMDYFIKKGIVNPRIINTLSNLRPRWKISRIINGVFYLGNLNKGNKLILSSNREITQSLLENVSYETVEEVK